MWGLKRYWWAIPAAVMTVLIAAIFRPELRSLAGSDDAPPVAADPATAEAPTAQAPTTEAPVAPPPPSTVKAAPKPAPPTPKPPEKPRPTEIDGKDAKTWRAMLRGAVMRNDGSIAADAFVALSQIDPAVFADRKVLFDAVTAAHLAASATDVIGDRIFDILAGDTLGHVACDILYRITSVHGGSRGAKRAKKLLADEKVLARGTPAMRIAMDIRDAPCKSRPALFERAAKDGDERAIYLLQAMRASHCGQISCCMRGDTKLDKAIGAIRTRIAESR